MGSLFDRQQEYEARRRAAAFASLRAVIVLVGICAGALVSVGLRRLSDDMSPKMSVVHGLGGAALGFLFGCGLLGIIRARRDRRSFLAIAYAGILLGVLVVAFGLRTNRGAEAAQTKWSEANRALGAAETANVSAQRWKPGTVYVRPDRIEVESWESFDRRIEVTSADLERARAAELQARRQLQLQNLLPEGPLLTLLAGLAAIATVVGSAGYVVVMVSSWRVSPQASDPTFWLARDDVRGDAKLPRDSAKGDDPDGAAREGNSNDSSSVCDIVQCPACQMRVIPKADGCCPSCQHRGSWVTG
jgi:hypothetical protein